jgi:hypothetical protein
MLTTLRYILRDFAPGAVVLGIVCVLLVVFG